VNRRRALQLIALTALLCGAVTPVRAQDDARLEIALPAKSTGGEEGPAFVPRGVLASGDLRDLLRSGFPARLHFRCELWRADRLNNRLDAVVEWDMLVRFDQLNRKYEVFRVVDRQAVRLGRFDTPEQAEATVERPYRIVSPPMRRGARYYYDASLDVEVLSLSDLERWLRGEVRPALSGDRNPGTALTRTVRGFFVRLLGGERRHYQVQSGNFRAE
jgi:hypothetical protein